MKRAGHLFERIVDPENLKLAFWKASRGKRARTDQRAFASHLEENIARLRQGLVDGTYPVGNYRRFMIHDPKEREICAARFEERVLQHALMNVCEPYFDRALVGVTFACRKNYGQLKAVSEAQRQVRRFSWYMKCDIHKYFDSIVHSTLLDSLERKFKDPFVLHWFGRIVKTYEKTDGRGLPIGNLTSQHFANLYLDVVDRFISGQSSSLGYVRYMDDFIVWSDNKHELLALRKSLKELLSGTLGLEFKQDPVIQRSAKGMDFLGMRVYPHGTRVARSSLRRFSRKRACYECLYTNGVWNAAELQRRVTALTAFLRQGDTLLWRRAHLGDFGSRRMASGSNRVIRGGSWNNNANNCRSANRNNNPSNENNNNGFRLACSTAPSPRRMVPAEILSVRERGENNTQAAVSSSAESRSLPLLSTK